MNLGASSTPLSDALSSETNWPSPHTVWFIITLINYSRQISAELTVFHNFFNLYVIFEPPLPKPFAPEALDPFTTIKLSLHRNSAIYIFSSDLVSQTFL